MLPVKSIADWMAERGVSLAVLIETAALDERTIAAIVQGRYTPSPQQRRQLASALGITVEQVAWGHITPVEALYGHGPQFGRSP
jgi:ribosome-binding protein aMBF1 (putative translation factor)